MRTVALIAAILGLLSVPGILAAGRWLDQAPSLRMYAEATGLSALIGGLLGAYELLYVEGPHGRWLRRAPFIVPLLASLAVYSAVMIGTLLVYEGLFYADAGPDTYMGFQVESDYLVLLDLMVGIGAFVLVFITLMLRRIVDGHTLMNLLLGRYRRPVEEQRVFLFLDLEGSTGLAENLGDLGVYEMISTFFFDIDEAILDHRGEPHRYVGDEVIISWPLQAGMAEANCLRCYFGIEDLMERLAGRYKALFGTVPVFRAGLHCGPVVVGQCGDSRREIHYFGDTLNTTSRIEAACRDVGKRFLVSGDVLSQLVVPPELETRAVGPFRLRGKLKDVALFSVHRRAAAGALTPPASAD